MKNTIAIIVIVLISQAISAQFYVGAQAGIGNIQSDVKGTTAGHRLGEALKVGYIYALTDHIGIGTGLEFAHYNQEVTVANLSTTFTNYEVDASTSAFAYNINTSNYKEKQTLYAVQVPLFVQFKKYIDDGVDFTFRVGAKYFLPVSYKIKATADNVNGSAYYPDVNLTIDDLPEYGFGSQANYSASGEYKTKGIVMSSFELGFTFAMRKKKSLYTALFLENGYGTIIKQEKNESFIGYNPATISDRKANGLYSTDKNATIRPVAFGATLGWNF